MAGCSLQKEVTVLLRLPDDSTVRLTETDYNDLCMQIVSEREDLVRKLYPLHFPPTAVVPSAAPASCAPVPTSAPHYPRVRVKARRHHSQIAADLAQCSKAHWRGAIPSSMRMDVHRMRDFLVYATERHPKAEITAAIKASSLDAVVKFLLLPSVAARLAV